VSAVPSLKDTTVEAFIDSIELLFPDPEHAARVAWLKLTDDLRFYLDAGNPNREVTWEEIKTLLLIERRRTTDRHESAYFSFRQREDETIVSAWKRFVGLANAADVRESRTSLWQYFRVRLTHSSKYQFREELKDINPLSALEKIAAAGDVSTKPAPASASLFQFTTNSELSTILAKVLAFTSAKSFSGSCYNCQQQGHRAKECTQPQRSSRLLEGQTRYPEKKHRHSEPSGQSRKSRGGKGKTDFKKWDRRKGDQKRDKRPSKNRKDKTEKRADYKKSPGASPEAGKESPKGKSDREKDSYSRQKDKLPQHIRDAFMPQESDQQ